MFFGSRFSLKKSKKILAAVHTLYKRKKSKLNSSLQNEFEELLNALHEAIKQNDEEKAAELAQKAKAKAHVELPKTAWDQFLDFFWGIVVFIVIVVVIRQMWFELYRIPSGSMRPTLKEKDFVAVSKTDLGLNIPLYPGHFYFNPDSVTRGDIFIFTVANMDVSDPDTMYFFVIPGKKQLVKRVIARGGDTIYFYGGRLYGINKEGEPIDSYFHQEWFRDIEHIPFIQFEGKVVTPSHPVGGVYSPVYLYQMNEPVAKLSVDHLGKPHGMMIPAQVGPHAHQRVVKNYYDLWGFKNFATAQILTKKQVQQFTNETVTEEAPLYLEMRHHPTFDPAVVKRDEYHRVRPALTYSYSILPLQESTLRRIFKHINTERFVVKNGVVHRYGRSPNSPHLPKITGIPNGTYEFAHGKAYKVDWSGITVELDKDHPIYDFTPERVQFFYNMGIEFDTRFTPNKTYPFLNPSRYVFYRHEALYMFNLPFLKPGDAILDDFVKNENEKPHPFIDNGPPINDDGSLNIEMIQKYGLTIPDKTYLALGDNHSVSSDSRDFGFVPENNIRGAARFIFWPPGSRWGYLAQPSYPFFTFPKMLVWGVAIIVAILIAYFARKRSRSGLKF